MFSLALIIFTVYFSYYTYKKSKPTTMHVNPVDAKNHIVDRYIEIQAMPEGLEKERAHKVWQQSSFHQIKKLQK